MVVGVVVMPRSNPELAAKMGKRNLYVQSKKTY